MSQRSVYIREEDEEIWKALPNKAEFIHNAIIDKEGTSSTPSLKDTKSQVKPSAPQPSWSPQIEPLLALACCLQKKPCVHWVWDGNESQYTNSRTGEVRSVDF